MSRPRTVPRGIRTISPLPRLPGGSLEDEVWSADKGERTIPTGTLIPGAGPSPSRSTSSSSPASSRLFQLVYSKVAEVVNRFAGLISFGNGVDGTWSGDLDGQFREVTVTVAGASYRVEHGLGRIPSFVFTQAEGLTGVYFDDADRASWNKTEIYLKVNVVPVKIKLLIV